MKEKVTGAEALVRSLIAEGATHVFGYPGGSIMPVYNALYDHGDKLHHILTRHEQGAIHAAQGFARVSGRPGVVFTTSGPGATNLVTGMADALIDSTPLVIVTGQVDSALLGFDAFQETDVVGVTLPVSKWSFQIRRPEDIAPAVAKAFFIASSGRPGPVILDFTQDVQNALVDYEYNACDFIRSYQPAPVNPSVQALEQAAALINSCQRPLIISGRGVMISGAEEQLRSLAEKIDAPVGATLMGLSTMPNSHRLMKGMVGMHGSMALNINTNKADLIIAVGMRFDNRVTGRTSTYAPDAKVIHIDIDESEFDKSIKTDVRLHGDARQILDMLLPMVNEQKHAEWLDSFDDYEADEKRLVIDSELHPQGEIPTMGAVVDSVARQTAGCAIIVTDVGLNQMMAARYSKFEQKRSIVTSGGLGTMGFGLPAAIGAKMACPDRQVVLFVGDGGLQMTVQELGTILENDTAVKIVLLNNNFLGNVRQLQSVFYGGRFSATPLVNPDFCKLAESYGIPTQVIDNKADIDDAVAKMLASEHCHMLIVNVAADEMVFPMTKAGDDVDHIMVGLNNYYDPQKSC